MERFALLAMRKRSLKCLNRMVGVLNVQTLRILLRVQNALINIDNTPQLKYEPEADVLSWKISKAPIDYAKEVGNFVVHFGKDNDPVLVEVLNAKGFMRDAEDKVGFKCVHLEMARA